MSDEYNVKLLVKQTKLNAKNALSHNEKYSGFKDLLKDNIPESLVDYNGNAYDISSVFHDTNWSNTDNTKTPSTNSSQSNQKFSQIETNANLELYKNARLVPHEDASGTTHKLWTVYDDASNNLLEHMINYKFDNSGSYLPILTYHNGSLYVESTMFSDPLWWLIDYENHAISFFNTDSVLNGGTVNISASSANPPKLTFYRYIGKTKVNNKLSVEGDISCNEVIVSGTTLTSKLGVIDLSYSDLSGVVTTNIGSITSNATSISINTSNITSNTNNKAPINNPTFTSDLNIDNEDGGLLIRTTNANYNRIKSEQGNNSNDGKDLLITSGDRGGSAPDIYIKTDGSVGIGTTDPSGRFDVFQNPDEENVIIVSGKKTSGTDAESYKKGILFKYKSSSYDFPQAKIYTSHSGSNYCSNLIFATANGTDNSDTVLSDAMTIDTDGNVGIGTSDPERTLHLYGNRTDIVFEKNGSEKHYIRKDGDYLRFRGHDDNTVLFEIRNNNTNNVCSFPNGRVGIGTTSPDPNYKLDVTGRIGSTYLTLNDNFELNPLSNNYIDIVQNAYYDSSSWKTRGGGSSLFRMYGGSSQESNIIFYTSEQNTSTASGTTITLKPSLRIDLCGNVCVGEDDRETGDILNIKLLNDHDRSVIKGRYLNVVGGIRYGMNGSIGGPKSEISSSYFNSVLYLNSEPMGNSYRKVKSNFTGTGYSGSVIAGGYYGTSANYGLVFTVLDANDENNEQDYYSERFLLLRRGGSSTTTALQTGDIYIYKPLYCNDSISCVSLTQTSDERIKENIRDASNNESLNILRNISCHYYEYKDKSQRGDNTTIGFIAQQVKNVFPISVHTNNDIIPNEMRYINDYSWNTIYSDMYNNISETIIYDENNKPLNRLKYKLTIHDLDDNSGNTLYRFYVSQDLSGKKHDKEIKSLEDDPKSFVFDQSWNNVFLYGKEVDDFLKLEKNKLFALNFSATKEIDRIQQLEKAKLAEAESEITTLKSTVETQQTTINTLQSTLAALEARIVALENP